MRGGQLVSMLIAALATLSGCSAGNSGLTAATSQVERPPNIVILFADDLGYGDLGSYGAPAIRTPHLDAMARNGQRWTDFYVAAPVCSPSRGALLTGQYPVRTGLYGERIAVMFPGDEGGFPASELSLAEALKAQGYATGMIGKWHLGDHPAHYPTRHGFDYWYGLPYSNDMDWVGHLDFDALMALSASGQGALLQEEFAARRPKYFDPRVSYWNVPLIRSVVQRTGDEQTYQDEIVERPTDQRTLTQRATAEALTFIERHRQQPFLLYVPYSMPHTPIFRSDGFVDRSLGGRYGDVIEELDDSVGQINAKLAALNLAENTLVVFTSDNGPWLTMNQHGGSAGPLRHGKGTTFEGGMRVPGIFYWPGTVTPAVVSGIGSVMDLYATALSLAKAPVPERLDSIDLSPTLRAGAPSPRSDFAFYRAGKLHAWRQGTHKLHVVTEGAYQQPPARAEHSPGLLYDLGNDPGERFDVSASKPEVVRALQQAIELHQAGLQKAPPLFDRRLLRLQSPAGSEPDQN